MKSHPLAPVFAMALLLAILMWLCSSCEKKPDCTCETIAEAIELSESSDSIYCDTIFVVSKYKQGVTLNP